MRKFNIEFTVGLFVIAGIHFFVDEKVPREERDSVPVVLRGEEIIWVAGYRADDRHRVTGNTKKFLRLVIVKGKF